MSALTELVLSDLEIEQMFSENAMTVLKKRYLRKGPDGKPVETPAQMFRRVAHHVAQAEQQHGGDPAEAEAAFYQILTRLRFVPNSPTFTGAGTPLGQLAACFVLPIEDDMGRIPGGIFQSLRDAALIQQTGGGNGFSFSRLRPRKTRVLSSMGEATGPVGFLRVYDKAFGEIAQGGTRRGANMAVLRIDHPDVEEFITCKREENTLTNFNLSVGILDAFMRAVEADAPWELHFPDIESPLYRNFRGTFEDAVAQGIPLVPYKQVRARDLFESIVQQAWRNGEPGMLFLDTAQKDNPVPHLGRYESTNPCGEQFLLPYENCCLGSINLARHLTFDGDGNPVVDWALLEQTVHSAVRFLDDVVTANAYVPAVPQLREAALRSRRIGLGIMGLADLLYHLRVRYGSPAGQVVAARIMEFIRYHAMRASIALARERGPFPAIAGSVYDPANMTWQPPQWPAWLDAAWSRETWGRPALNWDEIVTDLKRYGIRNAAQLTIAPTGTIATVVGIEGYGCEPVFALAYTRHVHEADQVIALRYVSPAFTRALEQAGLDAAARERIFQAVLENGSCQDVPEVPQALREVFVVAADVPAEDHIRMQAALQAFTDASISKTINFPSSARPTDIAEAFMLAWKLGCKGLTVYVAGSREHEVLETQATQKQKQGEAPAAQKPKPAEAPIALKPWQGPSVRPRPKSLSGKTYQTPTPLGTAYVTINLNGEEQPFEVFLNVGKAGSDTAAVAEAIGRLISLTLRLPSSMEPRERLEKIAEQLGGIGGGRPLGFGHNRILSLPDAVARVLTEHLREHAPQSDEEEDEPQPAPPMASSAGQLTLFPVGDLCPACGQAAMAYIEGCRRCYACGHSEC